MFFAAEMVSVDILVLEFLCAVMTPDSLARALGHWRRRAHHLRLDSPTRYLFGFPSLIEFTIKGVKDLVQIFEWASSSKKALQVVGQPADIAEILIGGLLWSLDRALWWREMVENIEVLEVSDSSALNARKIEVIFM